MEEVAGTPGYDNRISEKNMTKTPNPITETESDLEREYHRNRSRKRKNSKQLNLPYGNLIIMNLKNSTQRIELGAEVSEANWAAEPEAEKSEADQMRDTDEGWGNWSRARERFGYDEVTEDYIEECRYYEVNMLDNTEDEALESIITKGNLNARRTAKIIMKMTKTVIDYNEDNGYDLDVSKLTEIGKLYTLWRYVITDAVEWEIEE